MPHEDNNFGGSLVLDFRKWWRHVLPKNTLFFFYKNLFYKNVEAEIDPNFKNVLRTFLRLRVD